MADSAVFNVGALPDGTLVQSLDGDSPDDDTVVWLASDPDTKMSGGELSDLHEDVVWAAEPVPEAEGAPWMADGDAAPPAEMPVAPPAETPAPAPAEMPTPDAAKPPKGAERPDAAMAAAPMEAPPVPEMAPEAPQGPPELSEAQLDEVNRTLDEAEARIGEVEATIAYSLIGSVTDSLFVDEEPVDEARVASVTTMQFLPGSAPMSIQPVLAQIAALPADLPPDITERIQAIVMRLDDLDEQVAKMMLGAVKDEEIKEKDEGMSPAGDSTYVDETKEAVTAATGLPLDTEARAEAAGEGEALPDGKLPIRTKVELESAIKLRNNVKGHTPDAVKAHIVKRAKALNAEDMLPDDWS